MIWSRELTTPLSSVRNWTPKTSWDRWEVMQSRLWGLSSCSARKGRMQSVDLAMETTEIRVQLQRRSWIKQSRTDCSMWGGVSRKHWGNCQRMRPRRLALMSARGLLNLTVTITVWGSTWVYCVRSIRTPPPPTRSYRFSYLATCPKSTSRIC